MAAMAAHAKTDSNNIDDNDEEMAESASSETNESENSMEDEAEQKPPSKDDLIAPVNGLKNVTWNFVTCFELLNSPLLVIEEKNKRITFPVYDTSHSMDYTADDFKILNPCWVEYLHNYVVAQIKLKMILDFDVIVSLKKFSLIQAESMGTSLGHVDQDENTFATLVIQLPSKYEGGRHDIIKHTNSETHRFDISVTPNERFEFKSFAIVYHRNYKHQQLPITKGVGSYLVYSLKVKSSDAHSIPKERTYEDEENLAELMHLFNSWALNWEGKPGKMVIGLSNKYTKQNLSFENLKSTDLAIATLLQRYSYTCNFLMFLGFLKRTYHGEVPDEDTKFDTKDESNILQTDYDIECLKCIDGNELVQFQHLDVNFSDEVTPANCFDGVPFYRCDRDRFHSLEGSGFMMQFFDEDNLGFHIAKYYRVPVLVLFKRNSFIDDLKRCHTEVADIYKIFIALYHQHYDTNPIENFEYDTIGRFERFDVNANFRHWAHTISFMSLDKKTSIQSKALISSLLNVFIRMGELLRIKLYFENNRSLNDDIIPLLISQCIKFGWSPFSEVLCNMFKEVKKFSIAQKYFRQFVKSGDSTDPNKQVVLQSVFNAILDNESKRRRCDMTKFCDTVWRLGRESGLDIRDFCKSQKILDIVPFLMQQAERDEDMKSDPVWREIVDHFLIKMKCFLAKKPPINWRQLNVKVSGKCDCLENLRLFLADNVQSITFNLHKMHRNHIRKALDHLYHIAVDTSQEAGKANIVVEKTRQTHQDKINCYERILRLYKQLHPMLPCNS